LAKPVIKYVSFFRNLFKHNESSLSMADNQVSMPSGMGGLVRYSDGASSKIKFKPGFVIVLILLVIAIEFLLHIWGAALFG